jgi:hypothetical protein
LAEKTSQKVNLVMQWLPPIAWYFGGSVELKVLNKFSDIAYLLDHEIDIVMDTSHLFMGKNYYGFEELGIVEKLKSQIKWFHISGASGIDGEGRGFTTLTQGESKLMSDILKSDKIKIVEVWQGHLDNYYGFQNAIVKTYSECILITIKLIWEGGDEQSDAQRVFIPRSLDNNQPVLRIILIVKFEIGDYGIKVIGLDQGECVFHAERSAHGPFAVHVAEQSGKISGGRLMVINDEDVRSLLHEVFF